MNTTEKISAIKGVEINYFVTEDNVHFTPRRINLTFEYLVSYFRDGVDIEDALTREHIVKRLIEDETTEKNILLHSVEITKRKLF